MAVQNIVLYAPRLYASSTYATNEDAESLELDLFDDTELTDTDFQFLKDVLTLLEAAIVTDGVKPLADSLSMTEEALINSIKALIEELSVEDAPLVLQQIKGLSDFILVKDWLALKLQRANIWQSTPAYGFRPSNIHNYGPGVYYAVDFYASNPTVNWLLSTPNTATWQMVEVSAVPDPLYAQVLYSQQGYGGSPSVGWTRPVSTARQAWINNNGESHN